MDASKHRRVWTESDLRQLRAMVAAEKSNAEIEAALGRSHGSVLAKKQDLAEPIEQFGGSIQQEIIMQDLRFQIAMLAAILTGKETAFYGTYIDERPLTGRKYVSLAPAFSGCSSPAGSCAEVGERTSFGW